MNRSRSDGYFAGLSAAILLAGACGLAAAWPSAQASARAKSADLLAQGNAAGGAEAATDYRLATLLDPANEPAQAKLAAVQIAQGRADQALQTLRRAGRGSEVTQLLVRTQIELGQYATAADDAAALTAPGRGEEDLALAALAYALAGRSQDAANLTSRVSSPEAAQRVARANGSQLTLASELYATGLLNSSSALLEQQPASFERNLLYARILITRGTKPGLVQATSLLQQAVSMNPAGTTARQLLIQAYQAQGKDSDAANEQTLLAKLTAGRP
jgi:hypothetical protein